MAWAGGPLNDADSLHAAGKRHLAEGRPAEAHACLVQAAARRPNDDTILIDLARSLYFSGRPDEAAPLLASLVPRHPADLSLAIDLGRARRAMGDNRGAIETYKPLLTGHQHQAVLWNNLGNSQLALGQPDEAIASLRRAVREDPSFVDAHYNLGLALLAAGQRREGWAEYRYRVHLPAHLVDGKVLTEWDGTPMPGKTLFVRPEQGLGDTIQFCRYARLIGTRANVIVGVPKPLYRLLRDLPGVARTITEGDPNPAADATCLLMSLPRLLSAPGPEDAGPVPYLRADPVAVARWRARLDQLPGPRIGLVWAGSPSYGAVGLADRRRSIPLAALAPLRGHTFVSLQKGPAAVQARHPPEGMALIDWTEELTDFADTAALTAALDLVIGVDTSVVHLAGALGRPVWMLNRIDSDWRWGLTGETTAWYPSMRIFRQTQDGDWTAPIAAIAAALRTPWPTTASAPGEGALRSLIADRPDEPALRAALADRLLMAGDWAEGWLWHRRAYTDTDALWDGTAMEGGTLLLHTDDPAEVLLYGRYIAAAVEWSRARVVLSVPAPLHRLMAGWRGAAISTVPRPAHRRRFPFALLPVLFRARENTIPDIELCPMPPLPVIEAFSPQMTWLRGTRVGVAFDDPVSRARLAEVPGVHLVDLTVAFADLAVAAGVIVHLDLVIAGPGIVAHLAGALGRPVWLIQPAVPSWPWLPDRADNPWYPTLRQIAAADVAAALTDFAAGPPEERTFAYANDCHRRTDYRAAATGFRQTLAIRPEHPGALGNLAMTALILGRPDAAVRCAEQAVRQTPASQPLRFRFGLALHAAGRFDEAIRHLRAAREMEPGQADMLSALGNACGAAGLLDKAIETHRAAVAARPEAGQYRVNLAYTLLRAGQWDEGWREHEHRTERPGGGKSWDGGPLAGRPLLLRHEQGLGDTIQFCRFAPLAAERAGGPVFLTAPATLRSLLSGLAGVTVLTGEVRLPAETVQYPLLSLPLLFGTTPRTVPASVPYLHADPARIAVWRTRLSSLAGRRVGLVWAGNPRLGAASLGATDRRRSLPEGALAPLADSRGITFISLQVGDAVDPGVAAIDWTTELGDMAETAALVTVLDLVISVDTAAAHLAGALGRPVWLLNRFDTDWRWGDGTDSSVWYPAMRLFRQTTPGDWAAPIDRVARALRAGTF